MKTLNAHILRVAIALWLFALPLTAKENKANAAQFHSPQQKASFLDELFQSQQKEYTRTPSSATPSLQQSFGGSATAIPTLATQNPLLRNKPTVAYSASDSRMPAPQMHSVAMKLRETSRSYAGPNNSYGGGTMYSGAETAGNTMHSSNVTAVGASNAAAMYTLVTPQVRKTPPGTGGGNPNNPDIPVPVGEGVLTLLTAAGLFALQKRKRHS